MNRWLLPILGASLLLGFAELRSTDALSAQTTMADTVVWDGYVVGVRLAELKLADDSYTIRWKDREANRWLDPHTTSSAEVGDDPSFALGGSVSRFPAQLPELEAMTWTGRQAVAWPDPETVYVPDRERDAVVAGTPKTARRWIQKDGSSPMDLMIGPGDRPVAAFDVDNDIVWVKRGWEGVTTVARWQAPGVSKPEYGYRALDKQMVPMRDGVHLATLIYLPQGAGADGPFPVIFIRTPYGIGGLIGRYWHYAVRGYAVVLQAARGTAYWDPENRSEGEWGYFRNEAADGADALEWVASQPWSNGEICTQGASYLGYTQWNETIAGNPALKCMIPESSMGTMFSDQPYWGGGFVNGNTYYITWMLNKQPIRDGLSWTDVLHHRPLVDIDVFATGEDLPQWNAIMEHSHNDAYWARQNWYVKDVPRDFGAFMFSGWWDDDFAGTMANWALMRKTSSAPRKLVIGPWKHNYNVDRALNGFSFGPHALRDDVWLSKQRWYDHFLKGVDNGVEHERVQYFMLGENEWRTATDWPPPEAEPTAFYLHSDGDAEGLMTSGHLDRTTSTSPEDFDQYVYDPAHPVTNWMSFDQMTAWEDQQTWPYDFKDIEGRSDVVSYTSGPLEDDLVIAGNVMLVLYASTDVKDTDWWVHVSDVDPDGMSKRLTTGVLRARFRNRDDPQYGAMGENYAREELLSGDLDDVVEYRIGLRAIANRFEKGHRIRVAIYNALDNYEFPNSNTGGDEAQAKETIPGIMRVHHEASWPTHIILPVVPSGTQASAAPGSRER